MLMHRLKVIGTEHQDDKGKRRVYFDSLSQTNKPISAWFEWIIPRGATTVEAILDHANLLAGGAKSDFHYARPAFLERQALTRGGNDSPRQRVGIDEDLSHISFVCALTCC